MRNAITAFAVGVLALMTAFAAQAREASGNKGAATATERGAVRLADGSWASIGAYLEGTWK